MAKKSSAKPLKWVDQGSTTPPEAVPALSDAVYDSELLRLQVELTKLQEWVKATGARVVVIFEGRDGAGKGGTIARITQNSNARIFRVVALPAPTPREQGEWYFQRYVSHLPARGEIVLFDRSWYNRGGVESVMGFCTEAERDLFLQQCPVFEEMLLDDGIYLFKYWFSVSEEEQERRFQARLNNPLKRWKLSEMDLQARSRFEDFSRAKDLMFVATDTERSPWIEVPSDSKRHARINMISHLLSQLPYADVINPPIELPPRAPSTGYVRPPLDRYTYVPDAASLLVEKTPETATNPLKKKNVRAKRSAESK